MKISITNDIIKKIISKMVTKSIKNSICDSANITINDLDIIAGEYTTVNLNVTCKIKTCDIEKILVRNGII
jgi:hypothetical protein